MTQYQPVLTPLPKEYNGKLPVNELFYSIQGEGRWLGTPALFIRFQYCNLGCSWCDTRYAWDKDLIDQAVLYSPEELAKAAVATVDNQSVSCSEHLPHVVLTGGEPMLHQDLIPALIDCLKTRRFTFFEIETNGTVIPEPLMLGAISWWNCSPKLSNNQVDMEKRVNPAAIRVIAATGKADFRFVVWDRSDIDEIDETYGSLIPHEHIWLVPEGSRRAEQLNRMEEVAQLCLEMGYRFSPRLHILIWNNERSR